MKVQEINSDQHRGCQEDDNLLGQKCNEPRAGVTGDLPVVRCAALPAGPAVGMLVAVPPWERERRVSTRCGDLFSGAGFLRVVLL